MKARYVKLGLLAAVLLGATAVAVARQDTRSEVFTLQLQRFEGTYAINGSALNAAAQGEMKIHRTAEGGDWVIQTSRSGKPYEIHASSAFDASLKRLKASVTVDGKEGTGTVSVIGKELVFEVKIDGHTQKLRLKLAGRNDGQVTLIETDTSGADQTLVSFVAKRTA